MKLKSVGCSGGKIFLYLDPDFLRFLLFFIILSLIWFSFVGKLRPFRLRLLLLYLFHAQNFPINCFHVMTYFVYLTLTPFPYLLCDNRFDVFGWYFYLKALIH